MLRKTFLSYHHHLDVVRACQIRDSGLIAPNDLASDPVWAAISRAGDTAVRRWIDTQMNETDCVIVLVGQITAGRRWIDYEIQKAWHDGRGLFGIHIHNLKNGHGSQTSKGADPFAEVAIDGVPGALAGRVPCYDPPYLNGRDVFDYVCGKLPQWVERAIASRQAVQSWPAIRSA
jgi:MTH538 TIR-like domain (DUF1863)